MVGVRALVVLLSAHYSVLSAHHAATAELVVRREVLGQLGGIRALRLALVPRTRASWETVRLSEGLEHFGVQISSPAGVNVDLNVVFLVPRAARHGADAPDLLVTWVRTGVIGGDRERVRNGGQAGIETLGSRLHQRKEWLLSASLL